jgi:hypothetical protein
MGGLPVFFFVSAPRAVWAELTGKHFYQAIQQDIGHFLGFSERKPIGSVLDYVDEVLGV